METIFVQMQNLIRNLDWYATESDDYGIDSHEGEKLYNSWTNGNKENITAIKIVYPDFKYETMPDFIRKYFEYLEKSGHLLENELAMRFLETSL